MICPGCGAANEDGCRKGCPEVARGIKAEAELDFLFRAAQAKINSLYEAKKEEHPETVPWEVYADVLNELKYYKKTFGYEVWDAKGD